MEVNEEVTCQVTYFQKLPWVVCLSPCSLRHPYVTDQTKSSIIIIFTMKPTVYIKYIQLIFNFYIMLMPCLLMQFFGLNVCEFVTFVQSSIMMHFAVSGQEV